MIRSINTTDCSPIPSVSYDSHAPNYRFDNISISLQSGTGIRSLKYFSQPLYSTDFTPLFCNNIKGIYFSVGGALLKADLINNLMCLRDIEALKENWNKNGAPAFSYHQIQTLKEIIISLEKQPFITPTAKGSIQFEYEDEEGNYLEFEMFSDNRIKLFSYTSTGVSHTEYITKERVSKVVSDFYRSTN